MNKLSIIIVAFNNLEDIKECIPSIIYYNDIGSELEIIVIDNSASVEIELFLSEMYPNVIYKSNNNNGFGGANNVGAILASGEILLFLNADTILVESVFSYAISKFNYNKRLGVFGVQLVNRNLKHVYSFGLLDKWGLINGLILKFCQKFQIFISQIMFISGANLFVRKDLFFKVGCFDEKIFLYHEESDLIRRCSLLGFKSSFFSDKIIIHNEGGTIDNESLKSVELRLQSYAYYCSKYKLDFNAYCQGLLRSQMIKSFINRTILNNSKKKTYSYAEFKNIIIKVQNECLEHYDTN